MRDWLVEYEKECLKRELLLTEIAILQVRELFYDTPLTGADDDGDGSENAPFASHEHDHSGEFGAPSHLGVDAPVESITVDALTTPHHNDAVYAGEFATLNVLSLPTTAFRTGTPSTNGTLWMSNR